MKKIIALFLSLVMIIGLSACGSNSESKRQKEGGGNENTTQQQLYSYEKENIATKTEISTTEVQIETEKPTEVHIDYYTPGNFPTIVTPYDFYRFGDLATALKFPNENKFFFCDGNGKMVENIRDAKILSFPSGGDGRLIHKRINSYDVEGYTSSETGSNGFSIQSHSSFNMRLTFNSGVSPLFHIGEYDSEYGIIPVSTSTYGSDANLVPCSVIDWSSVQITTLGRYTGYAFELIE